MMPKANLFSWENEPALQNRRASTSPPLGTAVPSYDQAIWKLKRDPPRPQDLSLSSLAAKWIDQLPEAVKPVVLAQRYPRIANRLALTWQDPTLTGLLLDELRADKRGGRKGFPADVSNELARLVAEAKRRSLSGAVV